MEEVDIESGGSSGKSKDKLSFKRIVLEQYKKCCEEGSKELTLGGVRKRLLNNFVVEYDALNQVEIFINTVDLLRISLLPHVDKHKFKEKFKEFDSQLEELEEINNSNYKEYSKLDKGKLIKLKQLEEEYSYAKYELYKNGLLALLSRLLNTMNYFEESGGSFD